MRSKGCTTQTQPKLPSPAGVEPLPELCHATKAGRDSWRDSFGSATRKTHIVNEEVRQQLGPTGDGILVEVRDTGFSQDLFINKEVTRALSAVTGQDGMGRVGHDLRVAATGNRLFAS